jgi:UDP-2,3-diacylglucosamine pyrophosphatase LpxH
MSKKRSVDVVVISDVHLGTYGCHADELLRYLKSIKPGKVILNGDIIDIWQFSKRYWPKSHMKIIKHLAGLIVNGVPVYYITGNHDEMLRKFVGFRMAEFRILNKLVLPLNGKKAWIFHGDVFDVTMQHSKWLAKLGAVGYDALILLNRVVNFAYQKLGYGPVSMSKRIKNSVKGAVKFINHFEQTASEIAVSNQFDYVICGHIHQPEIRKVHCAEGSVHYLNSGDWVENLTSLEYYDGRWQLYHYHEDPHIKTSTMVEEEDQPILSNNQLFTQLQEEFNLLRI